MSIRAFERRTRRVIALLAFVSLAVFTASVPRAEQPEASFEQPTTETHSPQVAFIDAKIRQGWEDWGLSPSDPATDGEWCRRVHLDLLGRIPTVEELEAYLADRNQYKRERLVESLLFDDRYTEEYARNWTTLWTNILIGRSGGSERNTLTSREGMQNYLRDSLTRNKPYDRLVFELVTATGTNTPGLDGFNGAVNFLTMKLEEDAAQATAQTARIFLGMQVQCTQCHNHPFNDWQQQKFWELNTFFRQTVALRRFAPGTRNIRHVELANQDFGGEGSTPEEAEIYYELRNGVLQAAYPVFVDGREIARSGFLEDVDRRTELGRFIITSPYMGEAIVNRMWAHFLGHGFTKPIDDMGPHNAPSHPELLTYLGEQFRESGFDLKELMRWIVLSEAYSLSSRMSRDNATDDPLLGETPKFSHFYLRQIRAEELYESLLVATQAHRTRSSYEDQERDKARWLDQFVVAFGTDEGDETTTFNGTIPQALMMFNGELIQRATSTEPGGFLQEVAASDRRPREKIRYLYLAALARQPSRQEINTANQLLAGREGDTTAALQDIWWVLLNSNEFIMNH